MSVYAQHSAYIEEASYKGNDHVPSKWWHQLKLNSANKQKQTSKENMIVWVGNQLTIS
jgi:hypothetical protein